MSSEETQNQNLQIQQLQLQQQQLQQNQMQLHAFWQEQVSKVQAVDPDSHDFKTHQLPLARIKKIMKTDEDVRMISAEAPVLFAKACEMFILELSLRAWIHTEENKRRTLQRNDIAMAITKTDMYDFLIDIVPRDDIKSSKKGAMDPAAYQNQIQQQQAVMFAQIMQAHGQNPANWPQMAQQQQAQGQAQPANHQTATASTSSTGPSSRSTVDV